MRPSGRGSSRSIHASNRPLRTSTPLKRHQPGARLDADDRRLEARAQNDGHAVRAVRDVVLLVVDRHERLAGQAAVLDVFARPHRTNPDAGGRAQADLEFVPRLVPDLQLVLRDVGDAVADDLPFQVRLEPARGDLPAGVNAAHQEAEVSGKLRRLLSRIARRNADAASRRHQRRIDPLADRARPVVRVAVRAERNIDDRRNAPAVQPLSEAEQVVDRVRQPRRVVERRMTRLVFFGQSDQDARDRGFRTDALAAGSDARHVRARARRDAATTGAADPWRPPCACGSIRARGSFARR